MEKRDTSGITESRKTHLNDVQMLDAEDPIHDSSSAFVSSTSSDSSILSPPYRRRLRDYPELRPAKRTNYTVKDASDDTPSGTIPEYTVDDDPTPTYTPSATIRRLTPDDDPSSDYASSSSSAESLPELRRRRCCRRRRGVRSYVVPTTTGPAWETASSKDDRTCSRKSAKALPQHNLDVGSSSKAPSQTALVTQLRAIYTRFDLVHEDIVGFDWFAYRGWLLSLLPFALEQMQLNYQLEASRSEIGSEQFYGTHAPMLSSFFVAKVLLVVKGFHLVGKSIGPGERC